MKVFLAILATGLCLVLPAGSPSVRGEEEPSRYLGFEDNLPPWWAAAREGESLWTQDRREEAVACWEKARRQGYGDSLTLARMGLFYHTRGDYAPAASLLARARPGLELGAGDEIMLLQLYLALADSLHRLGRRAEASINYRRALRTSPESEEACLGLAELYLESGKFLPARRQATRALELSPDQPRALAILGRVAEREGDYEAAAAAYRAVLSVAPDREAERFSLAYLLFYHLRDYSGASGLLETLLESNPDQADARALLAQIRLMEGDLDAARREAGKALELDDSSYNALVILGRLALAEEDLAGAAGFFQKAYTVDRNLAAAEAGLGMLALEEGRLVEAEDRLRRARRLEPDLSEASYHLGVVLERAGKREEALETFRELVADHPGYFPGHLALGKLLFLGGRYGEAIPFFLNAAALRRDSWEARFFTGKCFLAQGKYVKAIEELTLASELAPDHPAVLGELALARWRLGETSAAEELFVRALDADPDYVRARINLAVLRASGSSSSDSSEQYRRALIVRPGEISWGYEEEPGELLREISEGLSDHLATGIDYVSLYRLAENLVEGDAAIRELIPLLESLSVDHPRQPGYPYLLGLCHQRLGSVARAEHYFNRALQLNLDFAPAHLSLGKLFLLQARPGPARTHLEAFLALWPQGPEAAAARSLLAGMSAPPAE